MHRSRLLLITRIHAEAALYRSVKFNYPYYNAVFEHTGNIYARHGCIQDWNDAEWETPSYASLCTLYTDLCTHVQIVRSQELQGQS